MCLSYQSVNLNHNHHMKYEIKFIDDLILYFPFLHENAFLIFSFQFFIFFLLKLPPSHQIFHELSKQKSYCHLIKQINMIYFSLNFLIF